MIVSATYAQFLEIVLAENNPQILYSLDKAGRPERVHARAWGGMVLTLLEAPTEAEFKRVFCYARRVETLEA